MSPTFLALLGAAIGLAVSSAILSLMVLGVSGVLRVGNTDLMYVFWPSSLALIAGWHASTLGVLVTLICVVTNCLLYAGVALLVGWGVRRLASSAKP